MQSRANSEKVVGYGDSMHGTLQDLSWDLGSIEHRVGQLEDIVKLLRADVAKLRDELSEVRRDSGDAKQDSPIPLKNNGRDNVSRMPSVGPADS